MFTLTENFEIGKLQDLTHRQQIIFDALAQAAAAVAAGDDQALMLNLRVALFNLPDSLSRLALFDDMASPYCPPGGWATWAPALQPGEVPS